VDHQLQFGILTGIIWLILILIFVAICVGISRDCEKIRDETRRGQAYYRTRTRPRQQTQTKQQAHRRQSRTQYAPIQLSICPECQATILAETTICPHCGSPQPICIVCNGAIVPLDSTLSCPHCRGRAHRIHFLEYLKVKGVCPRCKTDLDPHELIEDTLEEVPSTPSNGLEQLCMVCNSPLSSTDAILQCPHCGGRAHRIHLLEYLKVKGKCPHCQTDLDPEDLQET
jgi:Zn finger protein HypA/HybF involved in hydrogenase expression